MAAHKAPTAIAEAITLRQAGFTLQAISDHLGIPTRTLQAHFLKHATKKGVLTAEVLSEVRKNIVGSVLSNINEQILMLIHDDICHVKLIRNKTTQALEALEAEDHKSAALMLRATAAASVTLKNTSDTLRHWLEPRGTTGDDDLPVIQISVITEEEVQKMRDQQLESGSVDVIDDDALAPAIEAT